MPRTIAPVLMGLIPAVLGCYHLAQLAPRRAEAAAPSVYVEQCSSCHGEAGRGDGMVARGLDPPPRDFADPTWQSATSDVRVRFVIRSGGAAAGLSGLMAPHPDLTDAELDALVAYIRTVGAPQGPMRRARRRSLRGAAWIETSRAPRNRTS